jgi:hypothetical protein
MKVLHILKSEPDEMIEAFLDAFVEDEVETVRLYDGEVDWAALVDQVFAHDKVICWW